MAVGFMLYAFLNKKAEELGKANSNLHVRSTAKIQEVLSSYRENFVKNRIDFQVKELSDLRSQHANVLAEMSYLPNITKYSIELFVVVFIFIISAIEFARVDALHAVATISVFLMASSRIAPAVLRIQQSFLNIQSAAGTSNSSLEILQDFSTYPLQPNEPRKLEKKLDFIPEIRIRNLTFGYENSNHNILNNVSFDVQSGDFVAIVGPSGSGKSTLVDLLLGLLKPGVGSIEISGVDSAAASQVFAGKIGYLPQENLIINGTVRENVALGYPVDAFSEASIWAALEKAHAAEFIRLLPMGLDTLLGDGGSAISGGERQRLGIARTLLTDPALIVMDEATSALDSQTEHELTKSVAELRDGRTVIVVAHRLSTVKNANKIIYLFNGRIEAEGSFEEIKSKVPNFQKQAELQGM
jgi:ABC-type multidrug transport system fused ATPase/permease subunit